MIQSKIHSFKMFGEMGFKISSFLLLPCWVFLVLSLGVRSDGSEVALKLLETPHAFSNRNSATFSFQVLVGGNGSICTDCSTNCKVSFDCILKSHTQPPKGAIFSAFSKGFFLSDLLNI